MTLTYHDGRETLTRGVFARLPQTPGSLGAEFKPQGWQAWVPTPAAPENIEFVTVEESEAHSETRHRVINRQRVQSPLMDTTRFEVQGAGVTTPIDDMVDFDPADFSSEDFG